MSRLANKHLHYILDLELSISKMAGMLLVLLKELQSETANKEEYNNICNFTKSNIINNIPENLTKEYPEIKKLIELLNETRELQEDISE